MQRSKTWARVEAAAPSIYPHQTVSCAQMAPGDLSGWNRGSERNSKGYTCVSEGQPAGGWLGRAVGVLLLQVVTVGAILTWIEQRNTNHGKQSNKKKSKGFHKTRCKEVNRERFACWHLQHNQKKKKITWGRKKCVQDSQNHRAQKWITEWGLSTEKRQLQQLVKQVRCYTCQQARSATKRAS